MNERPERWLTVAAAAAGLAALAWAGATRGIASALGDLSFAILSIAALMLLIWAGTASARRWRIIAAVAFILIMSVALHPHDWARGMRIFYGRD